MARRRASFLRMRKSMIVRSRQSVMPSRWLSVALILLLGGRKRLQDSPQIARLPPVQVSTSNFLQGQS